MQQDIDPFRLKEPSKATRSKVYFTRNRPRELVSNEYRVERENSSLHNSSQSKAKNHPRNIGREVGLTIFRKSADPRCILGKDKFGFKGGWDSTVSETGRTNGVVESIFRLSSVWRLVGYVQGALPFSVTRPLSDRTVPLSATPHAKLWSRWISFQWLVLFYSASALLP